MVRLGRRDSELYHLGDLLDAPHGRFKAQLLGHCMNARGGDKVWRYRDLVSVFGAF